MWHTRGYNVALFPETRIVFFVIWRNTTFKFSPSSVFSGIALYMNNLHHRTNYSIPMESSWKDFNPKPKFSKSQTICLRSFIKDANVHQVSHYSGRYLTMEPKDGGRVVSISQATPLKPEVHLHVPDAHVPWPEQSYLGQRSEVMNAGGFPRVSYNVTFFSTLSLQLAIAPCIAPCMRLPSSNCCKKIYEQMVSIPYLCVCMCACVRVCV